MPILAHHFVVLCSVPGPVDLFRPINIGDNHVNLEWKPPEENRGDILGYDIGYQSGAFLLLWWRWWWWLLLLFFLHVFSSSPPFLFLILLLLTQILPSWLPGQRSKNAAGELGWRCSASSTMVLSPSTPASCQNHQAAD